MKKKKFLEDREADSIEITADLNSIEELLKDQAMLGLTQEVFEPSDESVARLSAIPLLFDEPPAASTRAGEVVYDSWSHGPAVALRDITDGHIRRIQLQAGRISVEIVAEKSKGKWEFVARVYRGKKVVHDFVISVGRKKLLSESGGFFRWSSKAVPRRIGLVSTGESLTFKEIAW